MLRCAMCDMPLRECCDIFKWYADEDGKEVVLCGDCAALIKEAEAAYPLKDEDGGEVKISWKSA